MAYVSRAAAVMEAHRAVVGVLQNGLCLLANLSEAEGNKVSGWDVIADVVIVGIIENRGRWSSRGK
jgi:hypothetical protein